MFNVTASHDRESLEWLWLYHVAWDGLLLGRSRYTIMIFELGGMMYKHAIHENALHLMNLFRMCTLLLGMFWITVVIHFLRAIGAFYKFDFDATETLPSRFILTVHQSYGLLDQDYNRWCAPSCYFSASVEWQQLRVGWYVGWLLLTPQLACIKRTNILIDVWQVNTRVKDQGSHFSFGIWSAQGMVDALFNRWSTSWSFVWFM